MAERKKTRAKYRPPVYFIQGRATVFTWTFINGYETIILELGIVMFLKKHFVYYFWILMEHPWYESKCHLYETENHFAFLQGETD